MYNIIKICNYKTSLCRIIKNVGLCLAGIRKTQCLNMFSQELNLGYFINKIICIQFIKY